MATRKIEVELVATDEQLSRTFRHAGKQARGFERDIGKASRGALAGSGIFRGLGRSLAFASGAFVGVASITSALRASVDAAEEFAKASKGLGAQLKANGESATSAAGQIAKANAEMAKFGITASESETALARLDRATGNIGQAVKLEGLAANVAAASHISLAQAARIVGKVVQGTTTAFNRIGIVVKKGTSVQAALALALKKTAGAAAGASTPLTRLHAGVDALEVAVGEALLPTINRIANSLSKWLSNSENVARVQRDVRSAVKVATSALQAAKAVLAPLVLGFRALATAVGGTTHAFEVLFALGIARKLGLISLALGTSEGAGVAGSANRAARAFKAFGFFAAFSVKYAFITGGLRGVAKAAAGARLSVASLSVAMRVGLVGAIGVAGFALSKLIRKIPDFDKTFKGFGGGLADLLSKSHGARIVLGLAAPPGPPPKQLPGPPIPIPFAFRNPNTLKPRDRNPFAGLPTGVTGQGLSPQARLNLDELRLADAQRTQNVKLQRAILVDEERLTLRLRDQAKTLKERTKFAQQAAQIEDQIRSIDQQAAADAKARRDAAAARAKARRAAAKAAAELARAFSVPLRAQLAEAKAAATKGTKDDLAAARAIKKLAEKALKSGRLGLQGQIDAWNAITTENQQIADLLKKTGKAVHTAFRKANLNKLLSGLGLTPDQVRAARARLSQIGAGGTVPGSGQGAFGFALPSGGSTVVHTQINLDGRKVATNTTRHQQRRDRRNPDQKRGPHAR